MKRITCRELGEKLGLSHSSVSLALRDHPSLPEKTRERVKALALELGYRPDPALGALNAYRQTNRGFKYQATLGWLNAFPDRTKLRAGRDFNFYFLGAQDRAKALGYNLEEFWLPTREHWKRLVRTLKSRRIEGLLVPPVFRDINIREIFPWEDFYAVALGELADVSHHLVINNQFQSAALTVRRLHALGYRKIGIVMPSQFADHTDFQFLGGYVSECAKLKLPVLSLLDDCVGEEVFRKHAVQWLKRHRPEAVIASGEGDILPALEEANLRVPEDIALAFLAISERHAEIAGIDQNGRQIGIAGTNQLVDLIRRNERGLPASPMRLLIEGKWIDGPSAPPKSGSLAGRD